MTARWLARGQSLLRSLFHRRQAEADLESEFEDYLAQEIQDGLRAGVSPEKAKSAAQRLAGPVSLYKEECRDARGIGFVEASWRDLQFAVRTLRRAPMFTAIAMATLALGIGANTTVFTFVENILLRLLPVQRPLELVSLNWGGIPNISYPNYVDFRDGNAAFSNLAAYRFNAASIGLQPRDNFRVWGYEATGNYFDTLGIQPLLGRFFGPADDDPAGSNPVLVISHRFWQSRFAGDPNVVG
ncbi:MAG: ABC transporter permease, partial [bacterium]